MSCTFYFFLFSLLFKIKNIFQKLKPNNFHLLPLSLGVEGWENGIVTELLWICFLVCIICSDTKTF